MSKKSSENKFMNIEILKGIPIPSINKFHRKGFGKWQVVFSKCNIGDSFVVNNNSNRCAAMRSARLLKIKVISRKNLNGTFAIWRTT